MVRTTAAAAFCVLVLVLMQGLAPGVGWAADGAAEPASPPKWYGDGVRPTDPRTPQQEAAGFHLPEGFEIRLFAAEPQIAKPMNLAFDAQSRVWVTQSVEYPYPAGDDRAGRDQVRVLQDTDGDGHADRVTCFADGLNIPIGVLPYGDGCICYSIPNLWYLRDTDGDLRCDKREKILGPFDTSRDTHGMINSLRRGADGWIYACHGFNNQSTVTGGDGHTIQMSSGNTFRFRPDGSRVEHFTWGQVNPFGMTFDQWGNPFTADCHSKPISQLIHGGCYPSFGRPDDGLGFVPPMLNHLHGSTAIAGLAYLPPDGSPSALAGHFLSGNVMTSRINRNRLVWQGATARGEQQADFLTSDDPWFRPVDVRWGPDGHLYVADFYNKIIGHYEVPLEHPGRDRRRGRIWQIRQTTVAPIDEAADAAADEIRSLPPEPLIATLAGASATRFALVLDRLADDVTGISSDWLRRTVADPPSARASVAALWALHRRDQLDASVLCDALQSGDPLIQVHAARIVSHRDPGTSRGRSLVVRLLRSDSAQVARAAAESLGQRPRAEDLSALLHLVSQAPPDDPILRQTARIAVRNLLVDPAAGPAAFAQLDDRLASATSHSPDLQEAASILRGVPQPRAAAFLLDYLQRWPESADGRLLLTHAVRHAAGEDLSRAVALARRSVGDDAAQQQQLIEILFQAVAARPQRAPMALRRWASDYLAGQLQSLQLAGQATDAPRVGWTAAWPRQQQQRSHRWPRGLWSSFPLGERYTGTFHSEPFAAPPQISFWVAGHNGRPSDGQTSASDARPNRVRLVDARTGSPLRTAFPPRHDQAVQVQWKLTELAGSSVRIEVVDGDAASAYAWIAAGGFSPSWLEPTGDAQRLQTTLDAIVAYDLKPLREHLVQLASSAALPQSWRMLVAARIAQLDRSWVLSGLVDVVRQQPLDPSIAERLIEAATLLRAADSDLVQTVSNQLTTGRQRQLANVWSRSEAGAGALLAAIDAGQIAPDVLLDKEVDQRLRATVQGPSAERLDRLRARAAASDHQRLTQIASLLAARPAQTDPDRGRTLFQQHCAVCHQLAGQGSLVGPQLDGVGLRGGARLLEDILAPDRNVDRAFRTSTILTLDGRVLVGLVGPETAGQITVVGTDGKPQMISPAAIDSRTENPTSLMPGNFDDLLRPDQLHDLLAYLESLPAVE